VITCFCPPHPADDKDYIIKYKDGNKYNCHKGNLEWKEYHYQQNTENSFNLDRYGTVLTINRDGTIQKEGETMTILNSCYNEDVDLEWCIEPYVPVHRSGSIYPEKVEIDELMDRAGFVQGDNAGLSHPAILHKDLDWMNFNSDNLEWVEMTDQLYLDYKAKKKKDMYKAMEEKNKGKQIPKD